MIPVMKPWLGEEEARAAADAVCSGWVAQGPQVAEFESRFAAHVGAEHGVAVSSCTTALHLCLHLLGIGPGDEVVVPSFSFVATSNCVRYVGATPVFADVEVEDGNISARTVEPVLTGRTRAVVVVDQGGAPADVEPLRVLCEQRGLALVEDAACAAGSRYRGAPAGSGGSLTAWSFHPRKLLTTGEGGMLTTSDANVASRARRLREHGMNMSAADRHASRQPVIESYLEVGFNFRMTDIQAAVGLVQLAKLDEMVRRRRVLAGRYQEMLADVPGLRTVQDPAWGESNFQSFWVELDGDYPRTRNQLLGLLAADGISARAGIMAAHRQPAYADHPRIDLPVTERLTDNTLILPLFHTMDDDDQAAVVDAIRRAAGLGSSARRDTGVTTPAVHAVPLVDLSVQHEHVAEEVEAGFAEVLSAGDFVGGKAVSAFEQEYADFVGARACVGVGNGTDALEMALRAHAIGPGDEVVLPANTFIATAEAVVRAGARPVFVDVDDDALLIDPARIEEALTARTRAVIAVDLYGQVAPFEQFPASLEERDIVVVEDGAQSQGARRHGTSAGRFGRVAATSFYPGKNLGAYGDAGAVVTDDADLAEHVRLLGAHGSPAKYQHTRVGFNSRLDTLQAVVLRAKLRRLPEWNAQRRAAASVYDDLLRGTPGLRLPATLPGNEHVWHLYVVRVEDRDGVLEQVRSAGVGAGVHYPTPVHLTPAMAEFGAGSGSMPVSERAAGELLSLPIYPGITRRQQERIADVVLHALRAGSD